MIRVIRGQRVILDADLAGIYGVATKVLNQAVKRNSKRFPIDFMFRLTAQEREVLRSQIATGPEGNLRSQIVTSRSHGGRRYLPYASTGAQAPPDRVLRIRALRSLIIRHANKVAGTKLIQPIIPARVDDRSNRRVIRVNIRGRNLRRRGAWWRHWLGLDE